VPLHGQVIPANGQHGGGTPRRLRHRVQTEHRRWDGVFNRLPLRHRTPCRQLGRGCACEVPAGQALVVRHLGDPGYGRPRCRQDPRSAEVDLCEDQPGQLAGEDVDSHGEPVPWMQSPGLGKRVRGQSQQSRRFSVVEVHRRVLDG